MGRPDILFVKPGSQKGVYGKASAYDMTAYEPPLWASLLAGFMREKGYAVELLDAEIEQWSHEETAEQIKLINPLLVVISVSGSNPSASTMNMTGAGNILRYLEQQSSDIRSCLHGLHPSYLPERTLKEEHVDYVCQGEGFYTFPDLVEKVRSGARGHFEIPGLWSVEQGKVQSNARPGVWKNLDQLPMPAWDLLPMQKYRAHNWHCFGHIEERQPYGIIYSSFGCPFDCSFCCINSIFGKRGIRYRSPQKVIEDIDYQVEHWGIRNFKIIDEMFVLKESHVIEICDLIISRGYDLNIWAYARTDTVKPSLLAKMRQAGIRWVAYGFEAGNKRVLEAINKAADLEASMKAVEMTVREGLYIGANFIFGLPEDDWDSMQNTLDLATEINAEWANFYYTMAYPGSRLYDDAVASGMALPESWQGYSQYSYDSVPLPTRYLSSAEIMAFRDYAFDAYLKNPRYLSKIFHQFDVDTVRYVQAMTQFSLKRKLKQFD